MVDGAVILVIVAFWQLAVSVTHIDAIIVPSPLGIAADIGQHLGLYVNNLALTAATVVAGFAIGVTAGAVLAAAGWWSTAIAGLTAPLAMLVRAMPLVAILPLLCRVLGYGVSTNIAICAILMFFPTYIMTSRALNKLPPGTWNVFRALGATRGQALRYLAVPAAVPGFMVSVKLNAAHCMIIGLAAEYITGVGGLGALYANERVDYTDPELGWSVAIITMALTFVIYALTTNAAQRVIERRK
jgi:ABC-type nitrate/sulfonate/bicarbonate transport system permease component